jgi:hypothetical protein
MKIVVTTNSNDRVLLVNIASFTDGNEMVKSLNDKFSDNTKSYKLVEDYYKLKTSTNKYLEQAEIR